MSGAAGGGGRGSCAGMAVARWLSQAATARVARVQGGDRRHAAPFRREAVCSDPLGLAGRRPGAACLPVSPSCHLSKQLARQAAALRLANPRRWNPPPRQRGRSVAKIDVPLYQLLHPSALVSGGAPARRFSGGAGALARAGRWMGGGAADEAPVWEHQLTGLFWERLPCGCRLRLGGGPAPCRRRARPRGWGHTVVASASIKPVVRCVAGACCCVG